MQQGRELSKQRRAAVKSLGGVCLECPTTSRGPEGHLSKLPRTAGGAEAGASGPETVRDPCRDLSRGPAWRSREKDHLAVGQSTRYRGGRKETTVSPVVLKRGQLCPQRTSGTSGDILGCDHWGKGLLVCSR